MYVPSIFSHSHSVSNTPRRSRNSLKSDTAEIILPKTKPKRRKLAQVSKTVKCLSDYKQLLDEVFVISRIIKVEVMVISRSRRLRLITLTETLIILDITKTESNNCFIIH